MRKVIEPNEKTEIISLSWCVSVAERVNNTIKNELLKDMDFFSIKEVREAVTFYNNERPHMSLDGMTPAEATLCKGEIRKMWCSYREKALKNLMI